MEATLFRICRLVGDFIRQNRVRPSEQLVMPVVLPQSLDWFYLPFYEDNLI